LHITWEWLADFDQHSSVKSAVIQGDQKVSVHLTIKVQNQMHRDFLTTLYKSAYKTNNSHCSRRSEIYTVRLGEQHILLFIAAPRLAASSQRMLASAGTYRSSRGAQDSDHRNSLHYVRGINYNSG
jgi:hypothetical protein